MYQPTLEEKDRITKLRELLRKNAPIVYQRYAAYKLRKDNESNNSK